MSKARHASPKARFDRPVLMGCVLCLIGGIIFLYPDAAAWVSAVNQTRIINTSRHDLAHLDPSAAEQIARAHDYNDALSSGVLLAENARLPLGSGKAGAGVPAYRDLLNAGPGGLMGHIHMSKIGLNLPIYHGTDDETLLRGAGHLEGTSLPVGGEGTRTVITAHRGLAEAEMFTRLNEIEPGDLFTLTIVGQTMSYRVRDIQVVEPEDREQLRAEAGADLATLVTCTPLGINTQRILVTGERVHPTPPKEKAQATQPARVPWPWWMVILSALVVGLGVVLWLTRRRPETGRMVGAQSRKKG